MSQIFDIVEELEKERINNKALQVDLNKYIYHYRYELREKENLQDRIDKAIEYIEHLDNVFIDSKEQDNIVDILKGEENE